MSVSILVVDDEPDVAELFRQRFRRETRDGTYVMHYAETAHRALDMLAGEVVPPLIVILSDINMPGMDGLALLREIKRLRPDLPVIMVTAYGDEAHRRQAAEAGAAEFITKPVDFAFLKERLRQLPVLRIGFDAGGEDVDTEARRLADWVRAGGVRTLNVAGNRESISPGIGAFTREVVRRALELLRDPYGA